MENTLGKGALKYWKKLVQDLNGGNRVTENDGITGWLLRNYKAAAVGANLRVVIQQPTAILRATSMIDPKYLARALPGQNAKEMLEHAPIALWKDWGYSQFQSGKQLRELVEGTDSVRESLIEKSMWAAGKADQLAWAQLWTACKHEAKAKNPDMKTDSEAFYKIVTDRFTDIIYHTQVVDSILTRSHIMRNKDGLASMATAFMSEPTRSFNMMRTATWEAFHGATPEARKQGKKRLFRTGMAVLSSQLVNAFFLSLYDAIGDEEDEKYMDKFWRIFTGFEKGEEDETIRAMMARLYGDVVDGEEGALLEAGKALMSGTTGNFANSMSHLNKIPIVKDILSMVDGYDVGRMDMANIGNMIDAFRRFGKAVTGEGNRTVAYALTDSFTHASSVFGIPAAKIKRELERSIKAAIDLADFAGADTSMMEYAYKKIKVPVNNANRNTYIDMAYGFEQNGAKDTAEKIYKDLIAAGVMPKDIETRKRKLRSDAVGENYRTSNPSYLDAASGYTFEEKEESEGSVLDNMTARQQTRFYAESEKTFNTVTAQAKNYGFFDSSTSPELKDDIISAARKVAEEKAKADILGEDYEPVKWTSWAVGGEGYGVDETEAILFKLAYDMSVAETNAKGNPIPGSKKDNTIEAAYEFMPWLTQTELEYLTSNYWKP